MEIIENAQTLLQTMKAGESFELNDHGEICRQSGWDKFCEGFCNIFRSSATITARKASLENSMVALVAQSHMADVEPANNGPINLEQPIQNPVPEKVLVLAKSKLIDAKLNAECLKLAGSDAVKAATFMALYECKLSGNSNRPNSRLTIIHEKQKMNIEEATNDLKNFITSNNIKDNSDIEQSITTIKERRFNLNQIDSKLYTSINKYLFSDFIEPNQKDNICEQCHKDLDRGNYKIDGQSNEFFAPKEKYQKTKDALIQLCHNPQERSFVSVFINQSFLNAMNNIISTEPPQNSDGTFSLHMPESGPAYEVSRNQQGDIEISFHSELGYVKDYDLGENPVLADAFIDTMRTTVTIPHAQFDALPPGTMPQYQIRHDHVPFNMLPHQE